MIQTSTAINAHKVTYESVFQTDIISQMQAQGWKLGRSAHYQRETALYEQDVLGFIRSTQLEEWDKFCKVYPIDSERHSISALVKQLNKADINATDGVSRTYGTLGVLRLFLMQNGDFKEAIKELQKNYPKKDSQTKKLILGYLAKLATNFEIIVISLTTAKK